MGTTLDEVIPAGLLKQWVVKARDGSQRLLTFLPRKGDSPRTGGLASGHRVLALASLKSPESQPESGPASPNALVPLRADQPI
ncbi:MAG: hypothetical protein ACREXR_24515, partial [Gammaproteobacteria bacterium]